MSLQSWAEINLYNKEYVLKTIKVYKVGIKKSQPQ